MSEANKPIWRAGFKNIEVIETEDHVAAGIRVTCGNPDFTRRISRIIAEAGNAYESTGLTPSQLAGQRNELLEALKCLVRSFLTDTDMHLAGWGDIDVNTACDAYDEARAAIAKAEGSL